MSGHAGQDNLLKFKLRVSSGSRTNGDLSAVECGVVVGISETADLLIFPENVLEKKKYSFHIKNP